MKEGIGHTTEFTIVKKDAATKEVVAVDTWKGNMGLNEGINLLATLLCGGAGTSYGSDHAYIGIGDASTAAAATQTGLQAVTNKAWSAMESGYPTYGTSQQVVWRSVFGSGEANFAWNEITVGNSNDDSGENLLRSVISKGTKVAGEEWTVDVTVTFS